MEVKHSYDDCHRHAIDARGFTIAVRPGSWDGLDATDCSEIRASRKRNCRASPRADGIRSSERVSSVPPFSSEQDRNEQKQSHLAHPAFHVINLVGRTPPDGLGLLDQPVHLPAPGYLDKQRMDRIAQPLAGNSRNSFTVWKRQSQPAKGLQGKHRDLGNV
jgi:hypothetical protein